MSVRKGDRKLGKLQVLDKSRLLKEYSLQIVKSFPKSNRWICGYTIVEEVRNIRANIRYANEAMLSPDYPVDAEYRRECQLKALGSISNLYDLIDDAYAEQYIEGRQVEYWSGLVRDVENMLRAWMRSDEETLNR